MAGKNERIFLLSPANSNGIRAGHLVREGASFELAQRVRAGTATIAEVFTFCSGLYFRGKVSYARRFAHPPAGVEGAYVITTSRGLVPLSEVVGIADLREFSTIVVSESEPRFTVPLIRSARSIASATSCDVVLLGSIATGKYVDCLLPIFGKRPFSQSSLLAEAT